MYAKEYFDLQLKFARKMAVLSQRPWEQILRNYTSFYKTLRIPGWDFRTDHPRWKAYLKEIETGDVATKTYQFYLEQLKEAEKEGKHFGCFSYTYAPNGRYIQLHFRNRDTSKEGPLSKERMGVRKGELKALFEDIRRKYPQAKEVFGFSWLYNLEAYKRLFPEKYVSSAKRIDNWFKSTALWGQFLDSEGEVKPKLAKEFEMCAEKAGSVAKLKTCFPYPVIEVGCEIGEFYKAG